MTTDQVNYKKVMVVDDELVDRIMARKVMTRYAFAEEVIVVESAIDALEYLTDPATDPEELPGLIFLDINMPEMNGFDFLDEYSKLPDPIKRRSRIVMLSSSLHPEDRVRALGSPCVCKFLSKPLTKEKLSEIVFKSPS
jgi:CheY-like chemotaxis protein